MAKPSIGRIKKLKENMPFGMASIVKEELRDKGIYPTLVDLVLTNRVVRWNDRHDLIIETVEKHFKNRGITLK